MALFDRFKKSTDETDEDIKEMAADVMSGDGDIVDDVKEMAADVMDKGDDIVESIDDAAPAASPPQGQDQAGWERMGRRVRCRTSRRQASDLFGDWWRHPSGCAAHR